MLISILLLLGGLAILIKGAGWLIDGAVKLAELARISPLVIGLTIVAFGTSTPELFVNISSALKPQATQIGLGNILGSNIANIGLILGLSAILAPLRVKKILIAREIPFMFLSALAFLILVSDRFFNQSNINLLTRGDGLILLLFFAIFIYYLTNTVLRNRHTDDLTEEFSNEFRPKKTASLPKTILYIVGGLVALVAGSQMAVEGAVGAARSLGVSDILIALTIVAVGTSLPELAALAVAAFKKEADIAIGNIVGSNIANTFFVMGLSGVLTEVPVEASWLVDATVVLVFSAVLFFMSLTAQLIRRLEGVALLVLYLLYMAFVVVRG